jgi:orotidine-5'-phosphate decarboxylase
MSAARDKQIEAKLTKDKLIVALDVSTPTEARRLVAELRDIVGIFKIGSQLFTAAGPDLVREIIGSGAQVFLDLKFHDIPHQVAGAARVVAKLGVSLFTVHASGGAEMMLAAVAAVAEVAESDRIVRPRIVGVTILTSADSTTLAEIGMAWGPAESVLRLARLAAESGLDGVVASAQEAQSIRNATKPGFLIVTPGIRPGRSNTNDQKRVTTPPEALASGADYLVIGRPITGAENPAEAAQLALTEMEKV